MGEEPVDPSPTPAVRQDRRRETAPLLARLRELDALYWDWGQGVDLRAPGNETLRRIRLREVLRRWRG